MNQVRSILMLSVVLGALPAFSRDKPGSRSERQQENPRDKYRPDPDTKEEKELTPEETLQILKECRRLMVQAGELLNDSSRGKSLDTERELIEKIDKLLQQDSKENPANAQQKVLEKIEKLMKKSEQSQGDTVEKLADVIRRAKTQYGQGQGLPEPGRGKSQQQRGEQVRPQQSSDPAKSPYDLKRTSDPGSKFWSKGTRTGRWGDLPPRLREAMLSGKRDVDEFSPEFQQLLKEYFREMSGDER